MPKTRPPYPPEYRRQAVELMRAGTPLKEVAADLGVSEQTLRNWRRQGDIHRTRLPARHRPRGDHWVRLVAERDGNRVARVVVACRLRAARTPRARRARFVPTRRYLAGAAKDSAVDARLRRIRSPGRRPAGRIR